MLNLWLCQESSIGESRDKVQELVNMHLPNIKSDEQDKIFIAKFVEEIESLLSLDLNQEVKTEDFSFLQLRQARRILMKCSLEPIVDEYL